MKYSCSSFTLISLLTIALSSPVAVVQTVTPASGAQPAISSQGTGTLGQIDPGSSTNALTSATVNVGYGDGFGGSAELYGRIGTFVFADEFSASVVIETFPVMIPSRTSDPDDLSVEPELKSVGVRSAAVRLVYGPTLSSSAVLARANEASAFCCLIRSHLVQNPPSAFPNECANEMSPDCLKSRVEFGGVYTMEQYKSCSEQIDMTAASHCTDTDQSRARMVALSGFRGMFGLRVLSPAVEDVQVTGAIELGVEYTTDSFGVFVGGSGLYMPEWEDSPGSGASVQHSAVLQAGGSAGAFYQSKTLNRIGLYGGYRHNWWSYSTGDADASVQDDAGEVGLFISGVSDSGWGGTIRIGMAVDESGEYSGFIGISPSFGSMVF